MRRQRFAAGLGGTLQIYPPEAVALGAPSSATVSLRAADGRDLPTPVTDQPATVDATATTIQAAASAGAEDLQLASVAGIVVGRRYIVTARDQESFAIEVVGISATNKRIELHSPLPHDVSNGDALRGWRVSFALAPANTPDPLTWGYLYRAVWRYVIGDETLLADQTYEVNRRLLKPTLVPDDVEPHLPAQWSELLAGGLAAIHDHLDHAWDDILDDLSAKGYRPDLVMTPEVLQRPHRSKVIANMLRSFGPEWREAANEAEAQYGRDLDTALSGSDWYDRTPDEKRSEAEKQLVQTVRLSR